MGFDDAEVAHLIRLGITTPTSHPTTYLKHHREVLRLITERLGAQLAADVEKRVNAIGAIAVVPRTRQEFEETEQGRILTKLPRLQVDRFASVRGPRSPEEWAALISGEATDTNTGLWPETGWRFGSIPRVLPTRGVLHGIKVLDVTRIVAGPVCTLQLSQLGADVLRIASPEIVDYPAHDLNLNLGKRLVGTLALVALPFTTGFYRTVELDLKTAAGRDKMRELIKEADVIVNNLLFGSLDKLGFGLASVLEMVKDRPRGIIYVETNTFGFYGPMASLPGVEPLGQHMTGLSFEHGRYQPYTDPNYSAPTFTAVMLCDVTTGLAAAAGVLVALNRRAREGGSYLVRGSLTQSALAVMDMGTYKDEQMIRSLWDGYPRHETSLNPEPGAAPHEGAVGYHLRLSRWMCERKTRGSSWESGFWCVCNIEWLFMRRRLILAIAGSALSTTLKAAQSWDFGPR